MSLNKKVQTSMDSILEEEEQEERCGAVGFFVKANIGVQHSTSPTCPLPHHFLLHNMFTGSFFTHFLKVRVCWVEMLFSFRHACSHSKITHAPPPQIS